MKQLILYDSAFGNTKIVAKEIAKTLGARLRRVPEVRPADIKNLDLLVVGSPTQGGRPMPALANFITGLPPNALKNVAIATFDTRLACKDQNILLQIVMKSVGYAADKLTRSLIAKGGRLAGAPAGFIVQDQKGSLQEGELARVVSWAKDLTAPLNTHRDPRGNESPEALRHSSLSRHDPRYNGRHDRSRYFRYGRIDG